MSKRRTNPELRCRIEEAATVGRPVAAVFSLRFDLAAIPEPAEVEARVARLLDRVGEETGQRPKDVHVLANIGSFTVSAPRSSSRG